MRERFRPSDYRFLAICLLLLAGTVWFSVGNFHKAFPEASIDFRVNRDQARAIASQFLSARGYNLGQYRQAARFSFDDQAKTFLEREAGLEVANQIMGIRIRLWRWSNRWFRPQQKEEFRADVSPRGDVVAFEHQIPEAAPRPSISADQARAAAEDFLRNAMHRDPAALDFVESSTVGRPARTDHYFTWKERDFNFKDSTSRIKVTVLGNEVGGYHEYLHVPEQWQRDYERLRSKNQAAQFADTAATTALIVGLLASLVIAVRRHNVRWRRSAYVGLVGGVLFFLSSWNEFPLTEFGYPTTDSYSSFLARQVLNSILGALASGGLLFLLTAAAEPLYREAMGGKISLGNLFRPAALRTRSFFLGTVLGITLTGVFVAYQTAFYMVAYRFGAWSPADVPYSDLLNTQLPWAFVLFGGFLPAVSEEFLFRMFAIPFLRKVFRSLWVAVILAGFLWGFGHAGYPQQPFYIRGVEVGIGGVALGLIMLRWGILPALVWHYSVDAMYSAMLLMRSDSLYFKFSGVAAAGIMVLPAAIALIVYFRNGGFDPETGLANADEADRPVEPARAEPETAVSDSGPAYTRWSLALRIGALAIFAAGALSMLLPTPRLDDSPVFRIGPEHARAESARLLGQMGADPAAFRAVAYPATHWEGDDARAGKYLLERLSVERTAALLRANRPLRHWMVRWYRPLDREEFQVSVHPESGVILGFGHILPEDRPGADIAPDAARAIAASYAAARGWNLSSMELKETTSDKKKARRDHDLVWEARPGDPRNVDEARYRVAIEVAGDQVTSLRGYWKLPESWVRGRSQQNAVSIFASVMRIGSGSVAIVLAILVLAQATRRGSVRWGAAIRAAVPFTILMALSAALTLRLAWKNYDTAIPPETYQAILWTGIVISILFGFLMLCAAAAFILAARPGAFAALARRGRRAFGADAVLSVLLAFGLAAILGQVRALLLARFHAQALFSVTASDMLASPAPAVSALAGAARSVLLYMAGLTLAAVVLERLRSRWLAIPAALALIAGSVPGEARTAGELALYLVLGLLPAAALALFAMGFARGNYLAYALAAWTLTLRSSAADLLGQENSTLAIQGGLIIIVLAATLIWALLPAIRGGPAALPGKIESPLAP